MRGIYVTSRHGDKATGFVLSMRNGRQVVQRFTRCTLAKVIENAARVIDEPAVYNVTATDPQNTT